MRELRYCVAHTLTGRYITRRSKLKNMQATVNDLSEQIKSSVENLDKELSSLREQISSSSGEHQEVTKNSTSAITGSIKGLNDEITKLTDQVRNSAELSSSTVKEVSRQLENLSKNVESSQKSSDQLGKKLFWLNCILTLATVIAGFSTFASLFK